MGSVSWGMAKKMALLIQGQWMTGIVDDEVDFDAADGPDVVEVKDVRPLESTGFELSAARVRRAAVAAWALIDDDPGRALRLLRERRAEREARRSQVPE